MKDAARNCVVEGTFDLSGRDMEAFFAGNDLDYAPETTVTRMITPAGKSRAFINDLPVQLAQLREFGTRLIDIHSQHQNLILSSEEFRTSALDTVAGNGELLAQYAAQYTRLTELRRRLAALREAAARRTPRRGVAPLPERRAHGCQPPRRGTGRHRGRTGRTGERRPASARCSLRSATPSMPTKPECSRS